MYQAFLREEYALAHHTSKRELWGSEIANDPPTVGYDEVMNDASESGMAKLTDLLVRQNVPSPCISDGLTLVTIDAIRPCIRGQNSF